MCVSRKQLTSDQLTKLLLSSMSFQSRFFPLTVAEDHKKMLSKEYQANRPFVSYRIRTGLRLEVSLNKRCLNIVQK